MPVTAKLSRLFYERLGEEVTNELVDWFNSVDATYRADLRELNELNFARFDAKLEQRIAALDAKLEQRIAELRAEFREGLAHQATAFNKALADQATAFNKALADHAISVNKGLGDLRDSMIRWMVRLWLATLRGEMDDDPIIYAARDWVSRLVAVCVFAVFVAADGSLARLVRGLF